MGEITGLVLHGSDGDVAITSLSDSEAILPQELGP